MAESVNVTPTSDTTTVVTTAPAAMVVLNTKNSAPAFREDDPDILVIDREGPAGPPGPPGSRGVDGPEGVEGPPGPRVRPGPDRASASCSPCPPRTGT